MTDAVLHGPREAVVGPARPHLDGGFHPSVAFVFRGLFGAGLLFVAYKILCDEMMPAY
jgi:hypothetical protein